MANSNKGIGTTKTILFGSEEGSDRLFTLSRTEGKGKISFCLSRHRKGRLPRVQTLAGKDLENMFRGQSKLRASFEAAKKELDEGKGKGPLELDEIVTKVDGLQKGEG